MNFSPHVRGTIALLLVIITVSFSRAGAGQAATSTPAAHSSHHSDATPTSPVACASTPLSMPTAGGMADVAATPAVPTNQDFDLVFIDLMIPHHESAIAMATIALVRGEHQEIRDLAQEIIASQQTELDQMKAWRDAWYPGAASMPADQLQDAMDAMTGAPAAGMSGMSGTMDPAAEATALCAAAGSFDQTFIQMMIPHHRSAVAMAEVALQKASHPEIKILAAAIISAQQTEIAHMAEWLLTWYAATPAAG